MRLTQEQQAAIRLAVAETFGNEAKIWLFGSRADDSKRGGDIDLLVCPGVAVRDQLFTKKISLLVKLEHALGERKIDVIIEAPNDTRPIVDIARETGIRL